MYESRYLENLGSHCAVVELVMTGTRRLGDQVDWRMESGGTSTRQAKSVSRKTRQLDRIVLSGLKLDGLPLLCGQNQVDKTGIRCLAVDVGEVYR